MLTDYEKMGKDFGLTHKKDYWLAFLTFRVLYPIIAFSIVYCIYMLSLTIGDLILTFIDYLGILPYSSGGSDMVSNFYLFLFFGIPILFLYPFVPVISTVPLARYRLEMLADPDDKVGSRLSRSFVNLKVSVAFRSLLTAIIILSPIAVAIFSIPILYLKYTMGYFFEPSHYSTDLSRYGFLFVIVLLVLLLIATPITLKLSTDNFLVPYILALDPDGKGKTVWRESKMLMKVHYKETFGLYLRLLLLGIPSTLLIIPLIWFIPYAYATLTYYALDRLDVGGYVSYAEDEEPVTDLDSLLQ